MIDKYLGVVSMDKVNEWIFELGLLSDVLNLIFDVFDKVDVVIKIWLNGEISVV